MAKKHSPELKAAVVNAYAERKATLDELSVEYGVGTTTILRWVRASEVPLRQPGKPPRAKKPKGPYKPRSNRNVIDSSPRRLKDTEGAWVYTDGIARWQPGRRAK